ncbi:TolC family protein [Sphingomonas faeni]|uniref:TolC family protein n=1 Tax=Sphingomonas faeni TaxID=185950 RepID=UPI00335BEFAE
MTVSAARRRSIGRAGRVMLGCGLAIGVAPAVQGQVMASPPGSLVVDPQQGATPRPLPASPTLPPAASPVSPVPAPTSPAQQGPLLPIPTTNVVVRPTGAQPVPAATAAPRPLPRRSIAGGLPAPGGDPLRIDPATDPVLRLARNSSDPALFHRAIADAVRRNPALDEATAQVEEADAVRAEARARRLPTADLSISSFQILSRAFSNDVGNVLERSRPRGRTDGLVRVQQPVVDWGSSLNRIHAGEARLEAARAGVEDTGTQIALRAIAAWYQVYGYRVLVRLADAFTASQGDLRVALQDRVAQGAAAPADVAQVDSYIASADAQAADFHRLLTSAEAQYAAVIGSPAVGDLGRAPVPALDRIGKAALAGDIDRLPTVRAARLGADAARLDARALRADQLPQLSAGLDAGRYGIIETSRDYDVRGSVTLSMRLGGGAAERGRQATARANGADARLRRTRIDAERDAEIALSDVEALEAARKAIESNYIASRQSRDVLAERFRVSRGTLFDLLGAENNYFGVAARYIQTVIELDSARYALLARTGRLLPELGIDPITLNATLDPR